MATDRSQAISRRMSRLLAPTLRAPLLIAILSPQAIASPHPGGDSGVRAGADGYTPWANTPSSRGTRQPSAQSHATNAARGPDADPCQADGMGGCVVRCADPQGTGICTVPAATQVTPVQLAQQAWNLLHLPLPRVRTAPPRGAQGLVGLAEWVWVPRAQWRSLAKTASAGAVWARVTATPKQLIIRPGAGLPTMSCGGPGTAYEPSQSVSAQRTDCSYTYLRSSRNQPGGVYRVTVTVVWGGTWIGSGGAGGGLPDISRSTTFALRVAEGQGLYE
jgi:hypothetical protein